MHADAPGGLRGFLRTKPGRVVLVLLATALVFGTYAFVSTVFAIPVFLLVGLGLPVWAGLKRPRFLALAALVVLLAVAPLSTVVFGQEVLAPPGAASSPGAAPFERGGSVLENATISPFVGSLSTNYTWNVTLYPRYLVPTLNGTNWSNDAVELFISTCPGATGTNDPNCPSGYSLIILNHTFASSRAPSNGTPVTFHDRLDSNTIWSWQMELVLQNTTNLSNPSRIELSGDPTFNGLEGPIVGGFATAYLALIVTVYEVDLLYLGVPFYFILLLYMWYKYREARGKAAIKRAAQAMVAKQAGPPATAPPEGGPPPTAGTPPPSTRPPSPELACPSCGAVVYPDEAKCWKCGSPLGSPASSGTPLSSGSSSGSPRDGTG